MGRLQAIFTIISRSFYSKLLIALLVSIPVAAVVADFLYAPLCGPSLAGKAVALKSEFEGSDLPPDEILHSMAKLGLSWLYVTDAQGKLVKQYKQFAPDLTSYPIVPRLVTWHNQRYYEVTCVDKNRVIHGGFRMEPLNDLLHGLPVPAAYAIYLGILTSLATAGCFFLSVSGPLKRIPLRLQNVLSGDGRDASPLGSSALVALEVSAVDREVNEIAKGSLDKLVQDVADARNDTKEAVSRERHYRYLLKLAQDLQACESSEDVCHMALHKVQERFPSMVKVGLAYRGKDGKLVQNGQFGLTIDQARALGTIDVFEALRRSYQTALVTTTRGRLPEVELPRDLRITNSFVAPLLHSGEELGCLLFFLDCEDKTVDAVQSILKDVVEIASSVIPHMVAYEKEVETNRADDLTGVTKLKYLPNYLEKLKSQVREDEPVAAFLVEGDAFMAMNEKYGKKTGDEVIKHLCEIVTSVICPQGNSLTMLDMQSSVFRYSAAQFLGIVRKCDVKRAQMIADRLRRAIEQDQAWPGGVPKWTATIGVAVYPDHSKDLMELVKEAEVARDYPKANKTPNTVCMVDAVPRTFRQKQHGNELEGSLGVFQPAALLQSIANAGRTGIMEVINRKQEKIMIYVEGGAPKKARLKNLCGNDAVIEFVSTFEEGDFNFREFRANLATSSVSEELTGLGTKYDISKPLESLLLDSALAEDNLKVAKRALPPQTNLYVIKESKAEDRGAWNGLSTVPEPPSAKELSAMQELISFSSGAATFDEIINKKMQHVPSHICWRAAQLLYQYKFIKLSALKVLATF